MNEIIEARTFTSKEEAEFWEWLGDSYLSSEDISFFGESGPSESYTRIKIKTETGDADVNEGDVICRRENGAFFVLSPEEADERLQEAPRN